MPEAPTDTPDETVTRRRLLASHIKTGRPLSPKEAKEKNLPSGSKMLTQCRVPLQDAHKVVQAAHAAKNERKRRKLLQEDEVGADDA